MRETKQTLNAQRPTLNSDVALGWMFGRWTLGFFGLD